jgi:hypothetical protein
MKNFKDIFKKSPEEKVTDALNQIENHPMIKKIRNEEQEKINLKRKEAISEITKTTDMIELEKNSNKNEIETETININKLRQDLQNSERRLCSLRYNIQKNVVGLEVSIFSSRKYLMSSYPELIDLFIFEMTERADKLRNTAKATTKQFKSDRHQLIDDRTPETVITNIPGINKATEFISLAIKDAEGLKLQDLSEIDVTKRLEFYWSNVPNIDGVDDSFLKPLVDISIIKASNADYSHSQIRQSWLDKNFPGMKDSM